jgi:cytochrome c-type protein NapC
MFDAVVIVGLLLALLGADQLRASRWGRRTLVFSAAVLPMAVSAAALREGVQESSRTRFCLSCHEMRDHGRSLFVDDRKALAAVHYQDRLIDRDRACYTCHTDYALFGDVRAKITGLKHLWVHYLGTVPEKLALYRPYPNQNCLHCHDDARGFLEAQPHRAIVAQIRSGELSCLKCHASGHNLAAARERLLWQAE